MQSVKGKVVIDAFRMIAGQNQMSLMSLQPTEPRQTTSNIGFLKKPTIQARIHGLDRHYYSLVIDWRKNDLEEQMLMNLHKKDWTTGKNDSPRFFYNILTIVYLLCFLGLHIQKYEDQQKYTEEMLDKMSRLCKDYATRVKEEEGKTLEEVEVLNVGKIDPKRHLDNDVHELMASSILQCLGTMIDTVVF